MRPRLAALPLLLALVPAPARAGDVAVAAAASVLAPLREIAARFEARTGHRLQISAGATGQLYAQIANGAPFDVFFAADTVRPARLEAESLAAPGTRFTYGIGRLALWSADSRAVPRDGARALREGRFRHLAIANPATAPYGAAAVSALRALGVWERVEKRLVRGENVAQTLQFVESGNAELGLVSLSQLRDPRLAGRGSLWVVPDSLHEPLRQDAVMLRRGAERPAARALLDFLRTPEARALWARHGYQVP